MGPAGCRSSPSRVHPLSSISGSGRRQVRFNPRERSELRPLRRAGSGLRRLVTAGRRWLRRLLRLLVWRLRRLLVRRLLVRRLLVWRRLLLRLGLRRLGLVGLLLVLRRVRQRVTRLAESDRRRGGLRRQLSLLRVAAVGDLAEADVGCLPYGLIVGLEVGRLLELEHVRDQ